MIWLTWRQARMPGLVATLAVVAVCSVLVYAGVRERQIADALSLPLAADPVRTELFSDLTVATMLQGAGVVSLFLTSFIGIFAGAALVAREFEERTHRLVWTQGISRERWFLSKTALIALALGAASILIALSAAFAQPMIMPLAATSGRFAGFDAEAPVIVGWGVLSFALGVLLGAVLRRGMPAVLATLVAAVALRLFVASGVRPHYLEPLVTHSSREIPAGSWLLPVRYLDANGNEVGGVVVSRLMRDFGAHVGEYQGNLERYLADNGVFQPFFYQPADRYWLFQGIELAITLGLALLFVFAALWLVRRARA